MLTKLPIVSGRPTRSTSLKVWSSTVVSAAPSPRPKSGGGLAVDLGDELDLGRLLAEAVGHLGERARRRRERLADRGAGHERVGVLHAAARVELEPVMALGLGQELRVVGRVGRLRAGGDGSRRLVRRREHRQDQRLGLALRERPLRHTAPGCPRRASRPRPGWRRRAHCRRSTRACPAHRGPSRCTSCSRSGCAGSRRSAAGRSRAWPPLPGRTGRWCWRRASRRAGWGRRRSPVLRVAAGVAAETAPASSVANACAPESSCVGVGLASVDRQRDARAVEPLDRPQAPGQVLAALVGLLRGTRRTSRPVPAWSSAAPRSRGRPARCRRCR